VEELGLNASVASRADTVARGHGVGTGVTLSLRSDRECDPFGGTNGCSDHTVARGVRALARRHSRLRVPGFRNTDSGGLIFLNAQSLQRVVFVGFVGWVRSTYVVASTCDDPLPVVSGPAPRGSKPGCSAGSVDDVVA
jgi:hypothetical protein